MFIAAILIIYTATCTGQIGWQPDREDRISIINGFDVKNAIVGGKKNDEGVRRNTQAFVWKGGFSINRDYWEGHLFLSVFQQIDYTSIGISINREIATFSLRSGYFADPNNDSTLAFLTGVQGEFVGRDGMVMFNPELTTFNPSIIGKIRWDRIFHSRFYLEFSGSFTARYDIKALNGDNSKWQMFENPSGFLSIGIILN